MSERQRQSRFDADSDLVVMKFGGTSVEDAAAIRRLIGIVQSRDGYQRVVVVSALARVTDHLLDAGRAAAGGHLGAALALVRDLYVRHEDLADELLENGIHAGLQAELRKEFAELESLLLRLDFSRDLDPQAHDRLLGFGECVSSRLVQAALREAGVPATHVDARCCIVTDDAHGQASPLWEETNLKVQETLVPLLESGQVPVLGGFIACSSEGAPTTLGRGGSDFSAALLGAALSASRVEIWTDVDGIMTTDPKLCPEARVIRKMSFEEAAELAYCGAKVLHPATLAPAMRANIPVHVLNSRRPEGEGTEIAARSRTSKGISAIALKRNVVVVDVAAQQAHDATLFKRVFDAFSKHACPVDLMATSPGRMSLLVASTSSLPGIAGDLKEQGEVQWENHKALVSLVGESIRRQPEVASQLFAAVSDLNVRVLCQGASERSISFLVDEEKAEESVQRLHALFFAQVPPQRDWGGISAAFCQAG